MRFYLIYILIIFWTLLATAESLIYTERELLFDNEKSKLYSAEFTPDNYYIKLVKAKEGRLGTETLLDMVHRYNPVVATNGTFFLDYKGRLEGVASWLLKAGDDIYATNGRFPVFYVSGAEFGIVQTEVTPYLKVGEKEYLIRSVNAPSFANFSSKFVLPLHVITKSYWHRSMTKPGTVEVAVSYRGNILLNSNAGNIAMPERGFILTSDNESINDLMQNWVKNNMSISYGVRYSAPQLADADYIISGSDLLLKEGEVAKHIARYKGKSGFINGRYARTAICIRNDNNIGLHVVEDRSKSLHEEMSIKEVLLQLQDLGFDLPSIRKMSLQEAFDKVREASEVEYRGVSLLEFAEILREQDCNYALNLDGGSSSTMVYKGSLSNVFARLENPDILSQRNIGDAIMVFPKSLSKNN